MKSAFLVVLILLCIRSIPLQAGVSNGTFNVGLTIGQSALQRPEKASSQSKLRYTCGAARNVLLTTGYSEVKTEGCSRDRFEFRAMKNGNVIRVVFDPYRGVIK